MVNYIMSRRELNEKLREIGGIEISDAGKKHTEFMKRRIESVGLPKPDAIRVFLLFKRIEIIFEKFRYFDRMRDRFGEGHKDIEDEIEKARREWFRLRDELRDKGIYRPTEWPII